MSINTIINNSSSIAIEKAFQRVVKKYLPQDRWLGVKNRYRKDSINKIKEDTSAVPHCIKGQQIAEYISASILTHCFDGWNFLSRSIESIISGDEMSAIHFAYYAELRAVLSLMATKGIGVFSNKHICFDTNEDCSVFRGSTHEVANQLVNAWSNISSSSTVFDFIKVNSNNLNGWISATGYSHLRSITSKLLKNWLQKWSMDLKLDYDQGIRNEASYRPKIFPKNHSCREIIEKISEIWVACEPSNFHYFSILDKHLLRITLDEVYSKSSTSKTKELFISDTVRVLGLTRSQSLEAFLTRSAQPNDLLLLEEARKKIKINDSYGCIYDCFPIICRALLLLRIASGATEKFLNSSTITKDLTQFWWQGIGLNLGLWETDQSPNNFIDLYQEIADALTTIEFDNPARWESFKTAMDFHGNDFIKLKQFQRVGLWGVGL